MSGIGSRPAAATASRSAPVAITASATIAPIAAVAMCSDRRSAPIRAIEAAVAAHAPLSCVCVWICLMTTRSGKMAAAPTTCRTAFFHCCPVRIVGLPTPVRAMRTSGNATAP